MTKKLEELFNLPEPTTDKEEESIKTIEQHQSMIDSVNDAIDKIDAALPGVRDLDTADAEFDELSNLARTKAEDLMDLGMNVEARYAGSILQTAGVLLGHAITAKQAKMDKKLRMIDLQLKKLRLDKTAPPEGSIEQPIDGKGVVLDRNELLAQILGKK
jgi:hypothetical protein